MSGEVKTKKKFAKGKGKKAEDVVNEDSGVSVSAGIEYSRVTLFILSLVHLFFIRQGKGKACRLRSISVH